MTTLLARNASENRLWLASKYNLPNALDQEIAAVFKDTIIRLLYVIPSSSETLVELVIENPGIGLGSGEETFSAFRAGININMEGFKSNSLLSPEMVEVKPGKQKIVLDLLPLSNSDQLVTIELKNL